MRLPENDFQILKLTDEFYKAYPGSLYKEILKKGERPYKCILFQTHYDYFICVPYRTEIIHKYSFRFKSSKRSKKHKSGLDYTKIVIIEKTEYVDTNDALIDADEFHETMCNIERIKGEALAFVEDYIAHMKEEKVLHPKEFKRRYTYSSLQYFHQELGLEHND